MTEVQVVMPVSEFNTAGLETEGIYRLRVKSLSVQEKTVQQGDRQGQKYKTIAGQFEMVERYGDGMIEYPNREFINFSVEGKGLERFRKFYTAALGPIPTGPVDDESGEHTVTLNDLAAALVGNDEVWTTYYWKRNWKDNDLIEGSLGYSFNTDPTNLKEPRPFAERDAA